MFTDGHRRGEGCGCYLRMHDDGAGPTRAEARGATPPPGDRPAAAPGVPGLPAHLGSASWSRPSGASSRSSPCSCRSKSSRTRRRPSAPPGSPTSSGSWLGSLAGGAILDAWDRRRLLMVAQVGLAAGSAILLGGAIVGEPPLWLIYTGLAVLAASSSLDGPTRSAITARVLVARPAAGRAGAESGRVEHRRPPRTAARWAGDRVGRWRRHRRVRGRPRVDRMHVRRRHPAAPDAADRERSRRHRAARRSARDSRSLGGTA